MQLLCAHSTMLQSFVLNIDLIYMRRGLHTTRAGCYFEGPLMCVHNYNNLKLLPHGPGSNAMFCPSCVPKPLQSCSELTRLPSPFALHKGLVKLDLEQVFTDTRQETRQWRAKPAEFRDGTKKCCCFPLGPEAPFRNSIGRILGANHTRNWIHLVRNTVSCQFGR
jgi:hypothetical protein